jgi:hypothetical protein
MIPDSDPASDEYWPRLPTETEIYILPSGEIVVADMPAELAAQIARLASLQTLDQRTKPFDDDDHAHFAHTT